MISIVDDDDDDDSDSDDDVLCMYLFINISRYVFLDISMYVFSISFYRHIDYSI